MKSPVLAGLVLLLCGCTKPAPYAGADPFGGARTGRFAGVGLYPAGPMWVQLAGAGAAKDPAAARIVDDEQIIVVVDSKTGELRQCGNFSGHCLGMNPWAAPLTPGQAAPAALLKHADDLAREQAARNQAAEDAAAGNIPRRRPHRGASAASS